MRKRTRKPAEERFWPKVNKTESCWLWTGPKDNHGYGQLTVRSADDTRWTVKKAYKFSYELSNGPVPAGMVVDHTCHNPVCVNPEHLRAITQKQNVQNRGRLNSNNQSGFRGVNKNGNRWYAHITRDGKTVSLGGFDSAEAAGKAALEARLAEYTHNDADRAA